MNIGEHFSENWDKNKTVRLYLILIQSRDHRRRICSNARIEFVFFRIFSIGDILSDFCTLELTTSERKRGQYLPRWFFNGRWSLGDILFAKKLRDGMIMKMKKNYSTLFLIPVGRGRGDAQIECAKERYTKKFVAFVFCYDQNSGHEIGIRGTLRLKYYLAEYMSVKT